MGVAAAVHYYKGLVLAHEQHGVSLDMVMAHAKVARVLEYVRADDRDGLAGYLLGFLDRLEAAGAECAVIPAVTPHFCIRELEVRTRLPLFNIFDPLRAELAARSLHRVAIFGTRFVMDSRLYGMVPEVEIVSASTEETDAIDKTYTELASRGEGTEEQHQILTSVAHTLCQRNKVDAIVFAGTDLAHIFNPSNTDFPYVDCAAIHIRAIAQGLVGAD